MADRQCVDGYPGQSLLVLYRNCAIYYDANEMAVNCIEAPEGLWQATTDLVETDQVVFQNVQCRTYAVISNIPGVIAISIAGSYVVVQTAKELLVYELCHAHGDLTVTQKHKLTTAAMGPARIAFVEGHLLQLYCYANHLQATELETGAEQSLHIDQFSAVDLALGPDGAAYAVTAASVIRLDLKDLKRSQQMKVQVHGAIQVVAGVTSSGELTVLTDGRQLLSVSLATYKITRTIQRVSKSPALYAELLSEHVALVASESNEVIVVRMDGVLKRRERQCSITQVKCDYYGTLFRSDSLFYGFGSAEGSWSAGVTESAVYFWRTLTGQP